MGLDATVQCTCWSRGTCTPPPFPLRIDSDGWLEADVPESEASRAFGLVEAWKQTCCPHPGLAVHEEHIGNWFTVRSFYRAVEDLKLPTLMEELPTGNGGATSASRAEACLEELRLFRERWHGQAVFLVDEHGQDLRSSLGLDDDVFHWGGSTGINIGFGAQGVYFVDRDTGRELFRARRLSQAVPDLGGGNFESGIVKYTDLENSRSFECGAAISGPTIPWPDGRAQNDRGQVRFSYPTEVTVDVREVGAEYHEYPLSALERVFREARDSGGLVRWC